MIKPFRVYNDVIKTHVYWDILGTRMGVSNMLLFLGIVAGTVAGSIFLARIHPALLAISLIGGLVALGWLLVTTERMSAMSKLPNLTQYRMMRHEAKNPVTDNYSHLIED